MQTKIFIMLGAVNGMLAVILGAFGAHALKRKLPTDLLSVYETAVEYHFYHALALLLIGLLGVWQPQSTLLKYSGFTMLVGILLFSGSLYVLAISGIRWLGAITPLGGLCLITAWALLLITAWRS